MKFNLFRRSRRQDNGTSAYFHDETFVIMDEDSLNKQKGWTAEEKTKAPGSHKSAATKSAPAKKATGAKSVSPKATASAAKSKSASAARKSAQPKAAVRKTSAAPKKK